MPSRQRAVMTLSVPPPMAAEYRQLAKEKGESASELFREMFAFYKQHKLNRETPELQTYGALRVREVGINGELADDQRDMVLISQNDYEHILAAVRHPEEHDTDNEALWVREAEARYNEIAAGTVTCSSLDQAVRDARTALK